jgi:NitT/TauT family transport system substrate-binding protein
MSYKKTAFLVVMLGLCAAITSLSGSRPSAANAAETETVRLAQPLINLSYLPIDVARASDVFRKYGLDLNFALISGGDAAILAALNAGDIQFAAVGTDAPLTAIAKGEPYEIVYCLNASLSQQLVVSNAWLKKAGVSAKDPLEKRLRALGTATIGVTALGGLQYREALYYLKLGGVPASKAHIAKIGPPPALEAALEHGEIDAFILSPPEGQKMEAKDVGTVLVRSSDVSQLRDFCGLALVVTKNYAQTHAATIRSVTAALVAASNEVQSNPDGVATTLHGSYYEKVSIPLLRSSITELLPAIEDRGRMTVPMMKSVIDFTEAAQGANLPLDAVSGRNVWWTDQYLPRK